MDVTWLGIDVKTWLAMIETVLKVVVAFVAGLWAFFLLFHLRQRARATAEIQKIQIDAEKAKVDIEKQKNDMQINHIKTLIDLDNHRSESISEELKIQELELKIRKQVNVSVNIEVDDSVARKDHPLITTVSVTNHGNEATKIKWHGEPPAFAVRFVSFDVNGKAQYSGLKEFPVMLTRDPTQPALSHVIRAGATETLLFAFQPHQPGLYLLSFRGATDDDVREEARKYGVQLPTAWTAKRYVYVADA